MADILFIMPRFKGLDGETVTVNPGPPLPFLWLAAVLEPAGYSVRIIDAGRYTSSKEEIAYELDKKPLFAGFYSHVGHPVISLIELSRFVKEHSPEIPVIHGGVLPSMHPELTLQEPFVDAVVIGEGEETTLELSAALKRCEPIDEIKGIAFKRNGKIVINPQRPLIDLKSLPLPAWHLIKHDIDHYLLPIGYDYKTGKALIGLHIVSSKGCPANCSFCFSRKYQKQYRCRSADQTLDEIGYLVMNFNVSCFYFHDEDFMINKKRVREICRGIKERGLDVRFSCHARVDSIDEALVSEASAAGLVGLSFGVEFCTEDALESYQKRISMEQVFNVAELCRKYNILSHFNMICGYPTEKYADIMMTVKVTEKLKKINPFSQFLLYVYTPNYGTDEYRELEEKYHFYPKELAGCEWLRWSTFKNREWIANKSLTENFYFFYTFFYKFLSDVTPSIYKNRLLRAWAKIRLNGPLLGFAPEISFFNLIRRFKKIKV